MAESSDNFHEPFELLSDRTRNMHRALVSLQEELEAIDWYQQRIDACTDEALIEILLHNMNEEIEHAMMNLEWMRRESETLDTNARTYLFTEGPITELEEDHHDGDAEEDDSPSTESLGIGSLRQRSE